WTSRSTATRADRYPAECSPVWGGVALARESPTVWREGAPRWCYNPPSPSSPELSPMRRRFFLVENPGAGVAGSPLVEDAVRLLAKAGASVARSRSSDIPSARTAVCKAAASGSYDAIVAAGGDGTIRHAAASLIGANLPLGIIPVGT